MAQSASPFLPADTLPVRTETSCDGRSLLLLWYPAKISTLTRTSVTLYDTIFSVKCSRQDRKYFIRQPVPAYAGHYDRSSFRRFVNFRQALQLQKTDVLDSISGDRVAHYSDLSRQ